MPLTHDRAVDLAVAEIHRMADVCRGADPATRVPTCPDWDLAELMRHLGRVNRWAATMVEQGSTSRLGREDMNWAVPSNPRDLPEWVDEGADFVEVRFRDADPDREMWAWGWPKTAGFWPRRMIHESGVHRADAELALGRTPVFEADVAADGVDELLDNLPHARYFAPNVAELKGSGEVLALRCPEASWAITLEPEGFRWERADRHDATTTLSTPSATDLLLTIYGRRDAADSEISGDRAVLEHWLANSAI